MDILLMVLAGIILLYITGYMRTLKKSSDFLNEYAEKRIDVMHSKLNMETSEELGEIFMQVKSSTAPVATKHMVDELLAKRMANLAKAE